MSHARGRDGGRWSLLNAGKSELLTYYYTTDELSRSLGERRITESLDVPLRVASDCVDSPFLCYPV